MRSANAWVVLLNLRVSCNANIFRHAFGKMPFGSARCCKTRLVVRRQNTKNNLPDAYPKKFVVLNYLCEERQVGAC